MKKIFFILVVFSIVLAPQTKNSFLKYATYYSGNEITYNGTELITTQIDRDFELGSELITDGTFDASGWTTYLGVVVGSGVATYGNTAGQGMWQEAGLVVGNRYKISLTQANTSGAVKIINYAGTLYQGSIGATGSWAFTHTTTGNPLRLYIQANNSFTGTIDNVSMRLISNLTTTGNHVADTSTTYKQTGSYSATVLSSAAGNGTTNTISLASTLFTPVTNGSNYRFQIYAYTLTANTTLTFKLGDIVKTAIVSTSGMSVINFDFKATASTTGNIILYLDKAATVYIDDVSLKSGQ